MHIQVRATPATSPADLEAFLKVLSEPALEGAVTINIEGVSGGSLENLGTFVVAVEDGREDDAVQWLQDAGYRDAHKDLVFHRALDSNTPGGLLGVVRLANSEARTGNLVIADVLIGEETDEPGHYYVQVAFEEDRTGNPRQNPTA